MNTPDKTSTTVPKSVYNPPKRLSSSPRSLRKFWQSSYPPVQDSKLGYHNPVTSLSQVDPASKISRLQANTALLVRKHRLPSQAAKNTKDSGGPFIPAMTTPSSPPESQSFL